MTVALWTKLEAEINFFTGRIEFPAVEGTLVSAFQYDRIFYTSFLIHHLSYYLFLVFVSDAIKTEIPCIQIVYKH